MDPVVAYLGLGSNVGDSRETLRAAVRILDATPGLRVIQVSAPYGSAPVGREDQPDFVNQVAEVKTELRPRALLDRIHVIERQAGRKRSVRWGPRTLDIDILWYDERRISEMHLQVPHPRIEERRFVLEPWSELAPGLVLPSGRRVREALKIVTGQRVRRLGIGAEEE